METIEDVESRNNVNIRTAQLVQLLTELGPDIPEIARRLGQFKESVRYRYKEKILNKGLAIQAAPNHERLGLKRVVTVTDVGEVYRPYAATIFTAMNDLCYVIGFGKTLPQGKYVVHGSVPTEFVPAYLDFLDKLSEKGLLVSPKSNVFEATRSPPMRAEFYDFNVDKWDYDWSNSAQRTAEAAYAPVASPIDFDYTDLLLVKELTVNAEKSLKEISDKLGINYKKLAWHYTTHVVAKNLIRGYRVSWMGTAYDEKTNRLGHSPHKYMLVDLIVRNLSEYERLLLMHRMSQIPFTWFEASGNDYFAEIGLPTEYIVEGLRYIEETLAPMRDRAEIFTLDQSFSVHFTLSYKLYNEKMRQWEFNEHALLARFDNLILTIKKSS